MSRYAAVLVVASSGGLQALRGLLSPLPADFALPVIVVLHTAADDSSGICELLGRWLALPVTEALLGERPTPGQVHVAPPGYHLLIESDGRFALSVDEKVCFVRPSADVLFESASEVWGPRLIAAVLTGANDDGARGLAAVRARGGLGLVQSPAEAQYPAMPEHALRIAGADHVAALAELGALLNRLAATAP